MPKTKLQSGDFMQPKPLSIIDIPGQPVTITIEEACKKFGISRQMVEKLIDDGKVFAFVTGLSEKGKRKISTYDLVEKANLFPKEVLVEIFKGEYEKRKAS